MLSPVILDCTVPSSFNSFSLLSLKMLSRGEKQEMPCKPCLFGIIRACNFFWFVLFFFFFFYFWLWPRIYTRAPSGSGNRNPWIRCPSFLPGLFSLDINPGWRGTGSLEQAAVGQEHKKWMHMDVDIYIYMCVWL